MLLLLMLQTVAPHALAQRVGFAGQYDSAGTFLSIRDTTPLRAGTPVTLVRPPLSGVRRSTQVLRASVVARIERCPAPLDAAGTVCYGLRPQTKLEPREPYLALAGVTAEWQSTEQEALIDIDGDRKLEGLRVCAGGDGLHFTIWRRSRGAEQRIWHEVFPPPSDLPTTCTSRETAPQGGDL